MDKLMHPFTFMGQLINFILQIILQSKLIDYFQFIQIIHQCQIIKEFVQIVHLLLNLKKEQHQTILHQFIITGLQVKKEQVMMQAKLKHQISLQMGQQDYQKVLLIKQFNLQIGHLYFKQQVHQIILQFLKQAMQKEHQKGLQFMLAVMAIQKALHQKVDLLHQKVHQKKDLEN